MPNFIPLPASTYLGDYNPNVTGFVSIDVAVQNGDITFDPANNIQNVTGNQKLIQDIMLFLLSPVGSNLFDASWGNRSIELLGKAIQYKGQVENLISSSVTDLQKFKSNEQNLRGNMLEASELISSIVNISISSNSLTDNSVQVLLDIETVRGDVINVSVPIR